MFTENPEICQSSLDKILADLPSNYTFVLVNPFPHEEASKNITPPVVLTYPKSKDLFVRDLAERFLRQTKSTESSSKLRFQLQGGAQLDPNIKLSEVRRQLRVQTLERVPIFMKMLGSFEDECCMVVLLQSEKAFSSSGIEVCFNLPNQQSMYLNVLPHSNFSSLKTELAKEIKRVFAYDLNTDRISLKFQDKTDDKINYKQLGKDDKISVDLSAGITLPDVKQENNSFIVIKGQGVKTTRLPFDAVKMKKTKEVLNQIEERPDWDCYGLNINGFILRPEEKIQKLLNQFSNSTMVCRNIAATIISESQMFQLEQQKIKESGKVDFEKIIVVSTDNEQLKNICQSKIQERAEQTSHDYFKNKEELVKPILIYTSELMVTSSDKKKSSVYNTINSFLRHQNFANSSEQHYKQKWQYQFANELIEQLKRIKASERKGEGQQLWRGVSYDCEEEVGDVITFKQFLSTSSNQEAAQNFAQKTLFKIVSSYSSKTIADFSYYGNSEEEYLFEPYTQFKVISIIQGVGKGLCGKDVKILTLQELPKPKIQQETSLILLWVDDKTMEGRYMWDSLKQIHKTAIMVQLMTTEELTTWLNKNTQAVTDPSIEIVMITNMTRYENGIKVDEAGVEAIKQYRSYRPDGQIYVYIGWLEGTLKKLANHGYLPNPTLRVTNIESDLRDYLRNINLQ